MVKNLPCDAGDMGSIPHQGTKIPCCAATKATTTESWVQNESLFTTILKIPHDATRTPCAATKNLILPNKINKY